MNRNNCNVYIPGVDTLIVEILRIMRSRNLLSYTYYTRILQTLYNLFKLINHFARSFILLANLFHRLKEESPKLQVFKPTKTTSQSLIVNPEARIQTASISQASRHLMAPQPPLDWHRAWLICTRRVSRPLKTKGAVLEASWAWKLTSIHLSLYLNPFSSYAGPNTVRITEANSHGFESYMATNRSVIYCHIDGRGSAFKGSKMLFEIYRRIGTVEIEDQIAVTR